MVDNARNRPACGVARGPLCAGAAIVALMFAAAAARADTGSADTGASSTTGSGSGSGSGSDGDDKIPPGGKQEIGLLPLIGGDTDIGFGGGVIGSIAELAPGATPYKWKLEFAAFYATKTTLLNPSYEDTYALLTFPELLDKRLRLEIRPSFTKDSALPFYGLGNYAPAPQNTDADRDYYHRVHPAMSLDTTWVLKKPWYALAGVQYTYNKLSYSSYSTLAIQQQSTDPYVAKTLAIEDQHSVVRFEEALIYDTRDNEISPYNGQYHMIKLRESPHVGDDLPYGYEQLDVQLRWYYTPIPRKLTLTARGVFDLMLGDPPFYELSRYEETSAIGGSNGVRGVPAYRYYGKVKAFVNLEARTEAFDFHFIGKKFIVGFAGFFDAGRLWSELGVDKPGLDGTGLGMHYGIGGGIRLQQGKTFVVRADLAWSPEATPVGAYLLANQVF